MSAPTPWSWRRRAALAALPAGGLWLAGCAAPTPLGPAPTPAAGIGPEAADAPWPPLQLPEGGRRWRLDAAGSRLRMAVFRAGPAARLGHHHLIEAGAATGVLAMPSTSLAGAAGEIVVSLAALRLDEPAWRREAGGEFNERPVSDDDIAATRRNLLSLMQADAHPQVRVRLLQLAGTAPHVVATVALQMAGRTREQRVALAWHEAEAERVLRIAARLPLSLRAFGLVPPSVLGGLLSVADDVVLDAQLQFLAG